MNGKAVNFSAEETIINALGELDGEAEKIKDLIWARGKYWDAYTRLIACISFFNIAAQEQPGMQSGIIQRLLEWIRKIKRELDKVVGEIGGDGYSIGVSAPFGVAVSISFSLM